MRNEFHGRRKRQGSLIKKGLPVLAAVFALTIAMPLSGNAAEESDVPITGALTVKCSEEVQAADIDLTIDLYKAAQISGDEESGYTYDSLLSGVEIGDNLTSSAMHNLAQSAAMAVLDPETGKSKGNPDKSVAAEERIKLDAGLYLLVARGVETDYVTKTSGGDIVTRASGDGKTYLFSPVLVSIPSKDAGSGEWQYNVEIVLKSEQEGELGAIKIVKTLRGDDAGKGPVTFVFDVEAVLDGEKVYSNVVTIVFDGSGTQELLVENIPVGAEVTVEEIYSGARCRLTTEKTKTVTIVADTDIPSVSFTNEYDERTNGGQGITNHFSYENGGWKLEQLLDKSQG